MGIECIRDTKENQLIVRYRKMAVYFECQVSEITIGQEQYTLEQVTQEYVFSKEQFKTLYEMLVEIGKYSWDNFDIESNVDENVDYQVYWDKEAADEGHLYFWRKNGLNITGPLTQNVNLENNIRLFKFDRQKLESFVRDLESKMNNM